MSVQHEDDPDGLRYVARVIELIREQREKRGWSSLKLSEVSGVHHSVISRAENGERIPGVPVLVRLCRALEVRLSDLCRLAEE